MLVHQRVNHVNIDKIGPRRCWADLFFNRFYVFWIFLYMCFAFYMTTTDGDSNLEESQSGLEDDESLGWQVPEWVPLYNGFLTITYYYHTCFFSKKTWISYDTYDFMGFNNHKWGSTKKRNWDSGVIPVNWQCHRWDRLAVSPSYGTVENMESTWKSWGLTFFLWYFFGIYEFSHLGCFRGSLSEHWGLTMIDVLPGGPSRSGGEMCGQGANGLTINPSPMGT